MKTHPIKKSPTPRIDLFLSFFFFSFFNGHLFLFLYNGQPTNKLLMLNFQSRLISLIFNFKKKIVHFLLCYEVHWCLFDSLLVVFSDEGVISLGLVEKLWSKITFFIQYYISFFLSHTFSFFYFFSLTFRQFFIPLYNLINEQTQRLNTKRLLF